MPQTCCATNCPHKSTRCKLKRFPTDKLRAKIWEIALCRKNFVRTANHRICECHFDANQYAYPGRLRDDAVPLHFPTHDLNLISLNDMFDENDSTNLNAVNAAAEENASSVQEEQEQESVQNVTCHNDSTNPNALNAAAEEKASSVQEEQESVQNVTCPTLDDSTVIQNNVSTTDVTSLKQLKEENEKLKHLVEQLQKEVETQKKNEAKVRRENYRILKKVTRLQKVANNFNDDQVKWLSGQKVKKWSKETVKKSLQVRFAVGKNGYEFLLKKGLPFVAYSTLCQRVQKLSPQIEIENIEMLNE